MYLFKTVVRLLAGGVGAALAHAAVAVENSVFVPGPGDLVEPAGIFYPGPPNLLEVQVRTEVQPGVCAPGEYSGCTLEDVNSDIDPGDDFKPRIRVHFQTDDFPDDGQQSNAELRMRGNTSRLAVQKSYRIKLDSKKLLWRGERRLQLNKHPWDLTRIRNMLSFDLMRDIPHLPSLNTQFVNLFIDDEDLGLYTHVEHVGKEYLVNRGWDKDSAVYKAENFLFYMAPALSLDEQGKPLDMDLFESVLEIKRGKEHSSLVGMLNALGDVNNDFGSDVFDIYFNQNNYLTWLAVNILMGNRDTINQNFYLYNPPDSNRFYFLPWDYDGAWGFFDQPDYQRVGYVVPRWKRSVGLWWDVLLHRRFLEQPGNLELLNRAVEEIREGYLDRTRIEQLLDSYHGLVYPLISRPPDLYYLPSTKYTDAEILQEYEQVYASIADKVEQNYEDFLRHQEDPMPFWLFDPELESGTIRFGWQESVDLQGDGVSYDLEIATEPDFRDGSVQHSVFGLDTPYYSFRWDLSAGEYYYRVIARDSADPQHHWQIAFSQVYDESSGREYNGVKMFQVDLDGTVGGGGTSAPPPRIELDGNADDWDDTLLLATDPDDVIAPGSPVDWRQIWMTHDAANLYIAYRNDGAIDLGRWWGWKLYFDLDRNSATGYRSTGAGAEYMLEGDSLWRYTGDGWSWSWEYVGSAPSVVNGDFAEISLPLAWLGKPETLYIVFHGINPPFAGERENDRYPENGYISYRPTPMEEELFSNPGAIITLDGSRDDWQLLDSFGADPDDISGTGNRLDWLEGWVAHDSDSIYFAYQNQGEIYLDRWWAWHIFIDTDNDATTGFGRAGAEYMLENDNLWRYTGSGGSWSWELVGTGQAAISGGFVEIAIPRELLAGNERLNLLFEGGNHMFPGGENAVDQYPDNGIFIYSLEP